MENLSNFPSSEETNASNMQNKKDGRSIVHDIFDVIELIALAFGIILFVSAFLFRHSVVSGDSMLGTLHDGEHLLISNFLYEAEAGDIIVCQLEAEQEQKFPHISTKEPLIKRIIATEGQRVKIENGELYVDGNKIEENYVFRDGADSIMNMKEITVSKNHVFIMGDHRNDSLDSRYFGEVDSRLIIGRVILRVFPFEKLGSVN